MADRNNIGDIVKGQDITRIRQFLDLEAWIVIKVECHGEVDGDERCRRQGEQNLSQALVRNLRFLINVNRFVADSRDLLSGANIDKTFLLQF